MASGLDIPEIDLTNLMVVDTRAEATTHATIVRIAIIVAVKAIDAVMARALISHQQDMVLTIDLLCQAMMKT